MITRADLHNEQRKRAEAERALRLEREAHERTKAQLAEAKRAQPKPRAPEPQQPAKPSEIAALRAENDLLRRELEAKA